MSTPEVEQFLHDLPDEARAVVSALRRTIKKITRQVDETVLWSGLSYHRPAVGGRVKGAVCQISVRAGKVRLEFIHGIRLSDPRGLLHGNRLSKRFVPIRTVENARNPAIEALIREASTLEFGETE